QGQELGMTNVSFPSIEDYDDAAMKYLYEKETSRGVPHEKVMKIIWKKGRDNSRTPMQWSDEANGGFSDASPWLGVNPNHTWLNAASQMQDETS
ncbi:alpha-amylase family glycosyl hydrolase, partial [Paenibacillus amylolyticus]|uniref:alpha-amylase family glycosyl hydrolase n=2 Tax=Bacillales TaxID=1385 RepID=UPI00347CF7F0